MGKTRVVVVDDSALVRSLLAEIINRQPDLECVGAASDPFVAREMIRNLNPDVITLDVEMPKMDGIDFLGKLMRLRPMPVVMVSTLTERGAEPCSIVAAKCIARISCHYRDQKDLRNDQHTFHHVIDRKLCGKRGVAEPREENQRQQEREPGDAVKRVIMIEWCTQLRDCSGSCHEYANSQFTTIKRPVAGKHHPTDGGF